MKYRMTGLDYAPFAGLFALDREALAARGATRIVAEEGLPCRVSLEDTADGEEILLINHTHKPDMRSPFRASGAIFVRKDARQASVTELPAQFTSRLLSLRAYDGDDMMVDADVVEGAAAEPVIWRMLGRRDVAHIDAHFARRGCFGGRIERAQADDERTPKPASA